MEDYGDAYEDRIQRALEAYNHGGFKSLCAAAHSHHVPDPRFHARVTMTDPRKAGRPFTNKRLNKEQEAAVRLCIKRYDDLGFSDWPQMIHNAATYIPRVLEPWTPHAY
ncbi:hypothetical protein K469DRAFT_710734 [Zopfia rhizophila CBS 207.26]|uniref:HTH CENPB-type domain-containing protein n=1 Tax=Zopfia rhizophila CBS 207.26 TaxID=1314779 RepID=A0A6A6DWY8_9PEZI|nr:hypothetical protein K469DRAFT_710734 [Zopfia rhizophila CBS 207.26]